MTLPADEALLTERLGRLAGLAEIREAATDTPVYLVGGAVRDLLLGRERTDVDVTVEGSVEGVVRALGAEAVSHERFATATVRAGGLEIDLAATRAESYDRPGALPRVRPASLEDDLRRRDFTINAMALPLAEKPRLIDPHGGRRDLERRLLRILHQRSFRDDPTRALRAARYAARLELELEAETARLLREADLGTVSIDRVEAELLRLAGETRPGPGFELAARWGLIELAPDGARLADRVAELLGSGPLAGIADRGRTVACAATGRLPGGSPEAAAPYEGARRLAALRPSRPSEAVEAAEGHDGTTLLLARAMGAEWLDRYAAEWSHVRLEIDGDDLLAAGVPEGPAIGQGLKAARRARLDGEVSGAERELALALEEARRVGDEP